MQTKVNDLYRYSVLIGQTLKWTCCTYHIRIIEVKEEVYSPPSLCQKTTPFRQILALLVHIIHFRVRAYIQIFTRGVVPMGPGGGRPSNFCQGCHMILSENEFKNPSHAKLIWEVNIALCLRLRYFSPSNSKIYIFFARRLLYLHPVTTTQPSHHYSKKNFIFNLIFTRLLHLLSIKGFSC